MADDTDVVQDGSTALMPKLVLYCNQILTLKAFVNVNWNLDVQLQLLYIAWREKQQVDPGA